MGGELGDGGRPGSELGMAEVRVPVEAELGVCKWRAGLGVRRGRLDWGFG